MCKGACKGICKSRRTECKDKQSEYKKQNEKENLESTSTDLHNSDSGHLFTSPERKEIRSEEHPFEGSTEGC